MEDSERKALESRNDELLDRARKVIRDLREKLAAAEARANSESIAIIGMAGRFPGAGDNLDAFWEMIVEGANAVRSVPADRWDRDAFYAPQAAVPGKMNTRHAAFLEDVTLFDAAFFDVTPREAVTMDPQQRIFLETAWHALEDAGVSRAMVSGSDTGVFVGVHSHSTDYCAMQFANPAALDGYAATGAAQDMIAGRLAYWLDLRGSSLVVNTACSSSLAAVHLACRSLRSGETSSAIVGGINLLLLPTTGVAMAQLQMLAADGHSKTFDARADGFGRGEGCGVVILKRLSDAVRDGDRVLAVIRGSAMNQDGRTNGLTAPSGLAQQRLLRRALQDAGVSASQIGYFETHGTGTALGDPIEVEAIAEVLGTKERTVPCALGSIKANIGHLEGGAGIAGLIKTVLVLRHGYLPPVANLERLNPHLKFPASTLVIPNSGTNWARGGHRFAGVSSFGWSGANVHVVLEEAPEEPEPTFKYAGRPVPVAVSGQTLEALKSAAAEYAARIEQATAQELTDIAYTSTMRRTHHAHRIVVVGEDGREMARLLRGRAADLDVAPAEKVKRVPVQAGVQPGLKRLSDAFEQGEEIDWKQIYPARGNVVSLPQYPFQGKRYWLNAAVAENPPRSEKEAPEDLQRPQLELRQDGCYLVTGALGEMGMDIGEWLAGQGARHLVLVERQGPGQIEDPELKNRLNALKAHGLIVKVVVCDLAEPDQVQRLFSDIDQCGAPLYGVIHAAAGISCAAVWKELEHDLEAAFRERGETPRLLDRFTRDRALDFFVLISSGTPIGSAVGRPDAYWNAVVSNRRKLGLPGLSVEWESDASMDDRGFVPSSNAVSLQSSKAFDVLGRLISSGASACVVFAADRSTAGLAAASQGNGFAAEMLSPGKSPELPGLSPANPDGEQCAAGWVSELRGLSSRDRFERLLTLISTETKEVFGMPKTEPLDENRGLVEMGMDSLMAVILQNGLQAALGVQLSATLVLDYPSITSLARFFDEKLFPNSPQLATAQTPDSVEHSQAEFDSVAEMSDSETDAALAAEMAMFQQRMGVL